MPAELPYTPISCDFHDILEATATCRTVVRVEYVDEAGMQARTTRVVDLTTRADGEYMLLESGESIRFDRIVSVDGVRLAAFTEPPGDPGPA